MKTGVAILLCCVYGLLLVRTATSYCIQERIKIEITEYGTILKFCEWRGVNILVGSELQDKDDCMLVKCTESGLSACGMGINAGVMGGPPGCRAVPDGCNIRFIRVDDPSQECHIN